MGGGTIRGLGDLYKMQRLRKRDDNKDSSDTIPYPSQLPTRRGIFKCVCVSYKIPYVDLASLFPGCLFS